MLIWIIRRSSLLTTLRVPDGGYSRNLLFTLNLICVYHKPFVRFLKNHIIWTPQNIRKTKTKTNKQTYKQKTQVVNLSSFWFCASSINYVHFVLLYQTSNIFRSLMKPLVQYHPYVCAENDIAINTYSTRFDHNTWALWQTKIVFSVIHSVWILCCVCVLYCLSRLWCL